MDPRVSAVADLVTAIVPADALEERHRAETLDWLASTDDVFRRAKPATPPRHLVSYVVPIDDDGVLLVAHRNAGLWLPPGGHVEPGEHPADTAARELTEELGVPGDRAGRDPVFLTVTRTVGVDAGHTDVSLWFVAAVGRAEPLAPDDGEFADVCWWSRAQLAAADPGRFDPHLARFLAKA